MVLPSFPKFGPLPDCELSALAVLFKARLVVPVGVGVGDGVGVGVVAVVGVGVGVAVVADVGVGVGVTPGIYRVLNSGESRNNIFDRAVRVKLQLYQCMFPDSYRRRWVWQTGGRQCTIHPGPESCKTEL